MMPGMGQNVQKNIGETLDENLSVLNPQDAFVMAEKGMLRKDMTIRELFSGLGVDVEGPVTQLSEMVTRETEKANPLNKMKAAAGAGQMADPVAARMSAGNGAQNTQGTSSGSLDALLNLGGM
jgi:hypothetical protein